MAANMDRIPRGQMLHFRYISIFGEAVSSTIKAYIKSIVNERKQSRNTILTDRKGHIKSLYKGLFEINNDNFNAQLESFELSTLCNLESYMLSDVDKQTVQFELQLSDMVVNVGESVTLFCKLNKDEVQVIWSKNGDILTNRNGVHILANRGTHILLIPKATTEDSGKYICECQDLSTSASVIVSEQELHFGKSLHIDVDGDIREDTTVSLSCNINIPDKIPRWFHNDQEIDVENENVTIMSTKCEHTLTIQHLELADEGEYMIAFDRLTSRISVKIKDTTGPEDLIIQKHIKEELFKYWMRGVLGLKFLKLGLESPAEKAVTTHHEQIVKDFPSSMKKCTDCNGDNLLPLHSKSQCPIKQRKQKCLCSRRSSSRRVCPNNKLCSKIYGLIVHDHRFEDPALKNSSMDKWRTDAWSVAACYMSHEDFIHPSEYRRKESAKELDCAELLTLFVNNKAYLPDTNYGVFQMAKRHRNELLHNASHEITKAKLSEYLTDFQDVLKVTDKSNQRVFSEAEVKQSLDALIELQNNEIHINTTEEIEQLKKDIRGAAMNEAATQLESALRQKYEELRNLEEKIKADGNSKTGKREGMHERHNSTGSSLYCIGHDRSSFKSHEETKNRYDFEYEVEETKVERRELPLGHYATNCTSCCFTCFDDCTSFDEQKARLSYRGSNGYCTMCPDKCHWTKHAIEPYILKFFTIKVKKTLADIEKRFCLWKQLSSE